jgi:hypothetical protein
VRAQAAVAATLVSVIVTMRVITPDTAIGLPRHMMAEAGDVRLAEDLIESGERVWTVAPTGESVWIVVEIHPKTRRKYLKTVPDGVIRNKLLELPECP